jgi:hypothetical protein
MDDDGWKNKKKSRKKKEKKFSASMTLSHT